MTTLEVAANKNRFNLQTFQYDRAAFTQKPVEKETQLVLVENGKWTYDCHPDGQ